MTVVKRAITINAPIELVTGIAMGSERRTEWYSGMQSHKATSDYPNTGSSAEVVVKSAGTTLKLSETILEYQPAKLLRIKLDGSMLKGETLWMYETVDAGTKVTAHFDYKMAGGLLGKALNSLVVEKANTEGLENSLRNLKRIAEQEADSGGDS